jgi:hypothetical protein
MDIERFRQLAQAHGAARRRWPEEERALFDRFAASAEGVLVLADAERMDLFLDSWTPQVNDDNRAGRILAAIDPPAPPRARTMRAAWLSTGFAACALFGLALGFMQVPATVEDDVFDELLLGSITMEEYL